MTTFGSRLPILAGYTLPVNAEGGTNSLIIQRGFPIDVRSIRFKLTEDNIGDSFNLLLRSSFNVGQTFQVIGSDVNRLTLSFRSPTVIRAGWTVIIRRNNISSILGLIRTSSASGIGTGRTVRLDIVRNPSDILDPIFSTPGTSSIFIGVPLLNDIHIVDTEDIVYHGGPSGVELNTNQELLLTYSPTNENEKTFTLYLDFFYNLPR